MTHNRYTTSYRLLSSVLTLLFFVHSSPLIAEEPAEEVTASSDKSPELQFDASATLVSDYIDGGANMYDGLGLQPVIAVRRLLGDMGSAAYIIGGHLSLEGDRQGEKFSQLDNFIEYEFPFETAKLFIGNHWSDYWSSEQDIPDTVEYYLGLSLPVPLNPSITISKDYRATRNETYELTLSEPIENTSLGADTTLTPHCTIAFSTNSNGAYSRDGLEYITVGNSLTFPFGKITGTFDINYNKKIDELTSNELWFGMTVAYP